MNCEPMSKQTNSQPDENFNKSLVFFLLPQILFLAYTRSTAKRFRQRALEESNKAAECRLSPSLPSLPLFHY